VTFRAETRVARARKPHRCDYCGMTIPKGAAAVKEAGVWDGDFYSAIGHEDCVAFWNEAYTTYADRDGMMAWDLLEAIGGEESDDFFLAEIAPWRGRFPHVVTRLEWRIQKSEIRYADRCRAHGFEPSPEDYEPVFG